jgi:hypothetical protein
MVVCDTNTSGHDVPLIFESQDRLRMLIQRHRMWWGYNGGAALAALSITRKLNDESRVQMDGILSELRAVTLK